MVFYYLLALYIYNRIKENNDYRISPNIGLLVATLAGIIMTREETRNF